MNVDQLYWFFGDKFPMCGCGNPELVIETLLSLLEAFEMRAKDNTNEGWKKSSDAIKKAIGNDYGPGYWLWLYTVDSFELIDHGSAVSGGWLADRGKELLEALRKYGTNQDEWNDMRESPGEVVDWP
jgi:hypothetical protein